MVRFRRAGRRVLHAAAVMILLAAAGPAQAAQVLVNPGFETGSLSPWAVGRSFGTVTENWNVTTTNPHSGTFAATDVGNEEIVQTFAAVPVSSITQISFWAAHPDATVTLLAYDLFYSNGSDVETLVNTTGTGYNFFNVTSSLTPGLSLTGFSIFGNSAGRTYFDDASIVTGTAVPEPASLIMGLLGTATIGLSCVWRRRRGAAVSCR